MVISAHEEDRDWPNLRRYVKEHTLGRKKFTLCVGLPMRAAAVYLPENILEQVWGLEPILAGNQKGDGVLTPIYSKLSRQEL
jgi:hypothetical protein